MVEYPGLDIILQHPPHDDTSYAVELRFIDPKSESDPRPVFGLMQLDRDHLQTLILDMRAYGAFLTEELFRMVELREGFARACAMADAQRMPLRTQVVVGQTAPELHHIRWETMLYPGSEDRMATNPNKMLFSRYLGSTDWQPVKLRSRAALRALVVIANPNDIESYAPGGTPLAPVDVAQEQERVERALGKTIPLTVLASGGQATLNTIIATLRNSYDILYLVAHGALIKGEPYLWLEDEDGEVAVTPGRDLLTRMKEHEQQPRLVVLASCQSAGNDDVMQSGDDGALSALGPRLADAGIPAVLAMQGNVLMQTVEQFVPTFFTELQRDGQVDRAMSVARSDSANQPDWWVPTLFTRLKHGRIWYDPGFGEGFEKWPAIVRSIKRETCTPIVGPRLTQSLLDSPREIARKWAERYNFPLAPGDRDDLPQVAQYLSVNQDRLFPREELLEYLRDEIQKRYDEILPDDVRGKDTELKDLFAFVGAERVQQNPLDPYKVLAELPCPVYVTTNLSNVLEEALRIVGKEPRTDICRWNESLQMLPSLEDNEPGYRPSVDTPLVYYLFGCSKEPDSLVLAEDDYFDYLIAMSRDKELIPSVVRRALADTSLLFLGFQMDSWDFRVLFRSLMNVEGRGRRRRYAHVAAQIEPEEDRFLQPSRAHRYIESYFQESDISIYWGYVEDFVQELRSQLPS